MKISIITVCKNPGEMIKKTVESVLAQTYQDIEYIIIDGASRDGTVGYIEEIYGLISKGERFFAPTKCFQFISEIDSGIYHAMNKGISLAKGDIVYFLNAGDRLFNESVVENVVKEFVKSGADFIYTDIFCEDGNSGYMKKFDRVDRYFLIRDCISHQASFYKREIFDKLGKFYEKFIIASDYELLLKIMKEDSLNKRYLPIISAYYDATGISSSNRDLLKTERFEIIENCFSSFERFVYNNCLYQFFRRRFRNARFKIYG